MEWDNNLFTQIENWDISLCLNIKNISEQELAEAQDKFIKLTSLKQRAVVSDVLGMRTKKTKYYISSIESYNAYIINLIDKIRNSAENNYHLIDDLRGDIKASFIRSYIYRNVNKKIWRQIIDTLYTFIKDYQYIFLFDIVTCFLLLVAENTKFQDILSIYNDLLVKADDYSRLEWIFNINHSPFFNTTHLFDPYEGENNIKNIINTARSKIEKSDKFESIKVLASGGFLKRVLNKNNYCSPIPTWINKILSNDDKNNLNNYLKKIHISSDKEVSLDLKLNKEIHDTIERIKNLNSLEEIIKIIITIDTSEFIKHNMGTFDYLVGPNSMMTYTIKLITGEVYHKDSEDIKYEKLNCLYKYIFEQIPTGAVNSEMVQNLLDKWIIVKSEFHNVLKEYFYSILDTTTTEWQKKANINQIVLLVEPILGTLKPSEYAKFCNNNTNGTVECRGLEYKKYLQSLLKEKNSSEAEFLLNPFINHRIKVAHGKTFDSFGNCYFILQGIIKIFYMKYSDFDLSNE